ncbi:flagellar biosynthesis protein FlgA [Georgenia yuyongxinii]|uniref:Flagellar biosynthesis protein FlgA n=1 Tax=Georgenia yuyongxinii TaxID=2589797 RepID=A0A5B8C2L4_9MICO|nr:SAF domain-containing protein [Georgenia yuyongxinii]QDC23761.1 flagellar biosynthesis protein FlgA [Georgenia yuyongxinii]
MRTRQPPPPSRSTATRLRRGMWRRRHVLAAVCLGLAAATAVSALRPAPPPHEDVVVLRADVSAGTPLAAADVVIRPVPAGLAPSGALRTLAEAVGQPLAVGLPAGTPLLPGMLAGPGLAAAAPPGTVVIAVPVADAASARLAQPGRHISLVAVTSDTTGTPGEARVIARDLVVLAVDADVSEGLLGAGTSGMTYVYVAAPERLATVLVGSSAWAPLRAVLEAP